MALTYLYGYHPVLRAVLPDSFIKVKKVLLVANKYHALKTQLETNQIKYEIISLQEMNNLLKTTKHQNIAAQVENYQYYALDQILTKHDKNRFLRFLILDRISDPHNFGAMLRIAAGNDFDAVIVLNRNQAQINGVVGKAAAGALSVIRICEVSNLTTTINMLQTKYQFWILGAAQSLTAINYSFLQCDSNLALIIGNEGEGISPKLLKHTDLQLQIPMSNKIESFNASVACGIIVNYIYCETLKLNTNKS